MGDLVATWFISMLNGIIFGASILGVSGTILYLNLNSSVGCYPSDLLLMEKPDILPMEDTFLLYDIPRIRESLAQLPNKENVL